MVVTFSAPKPPKTPLLFSSLLFSQNPPKTLILSQAMAYNLSAPPSSSLLCTSLSLPKLPHPKNVNFPLKLHRPKLSFHISAQDPNLNAVTQSSQIPTQKLMLYKIVESLNSCAPLEDAVSGVLDDLGDEMVKRYAVVILSNMSNRETAPLVFNNFLKRLKLNKEVDLHNAALRVFMKRKDLGKAEDLFNLMLERGVTPNYITFSTIMTCYRLSSLDEKSLDEKAVEWFEKMRSLGYEPDKETCSMMINVYEVVGNNTAALHIYDYAITKRLPLDAVAFCTMMRIYTSEWNYYGCLYLYKEMMALGVKGDAFVYDTLLNAMGKAKMSWQAKLVFGRMIRSSVEPMRDTYIALIMAYNREGYGKDALVVYEEMKRKQLKMTVRLYNCILSTCAYEGEGFADEATRIFNDLKNSGECKPNEWTYTIMIEIYSRSGKDEELKATSKEMDDAGFDSPSAYKKKLA